MAYREMKGKQMNWDDRDSWDFKTVAKCAKYYDTREIFDWELPSAHEVFGYVNECIEIEIQRLRGMIIDDDVEFDSEYQEFLTELRPIAAKLFLENINSKLFTDE